MSFRKGIPTIYRGIRFRSRIEARWAALFDQLRWPWEYEPIDLDGYIPDFVLTFRKPLLVEVKFDLSIDSLEQYVGKIESSGWPNEALIVGARIFEDTDVGEPCLGLHGEALPEQYRSHPGSLAWGPAVACLCGDGGIGIYNRSMGWGCRRCGGCDAKDPRPGKPMGDEIERARARIDAALAAAGNSVQWRSPQ